MLASSSIQAFAQQTTSSACVHGSHPSLAPTDAAARLETIAQALLDAIAVGDTAVWNRYLADDVIITDENGATRTKREVIAELRPLPPGYSGELCLASPTVRVSNGVGVLSYDALERETIFGQTLHTRYHTTDTYVDRGGQWKLIASQTSVLPSEHRAVRVDAKTLDAYAGRYELAPGVTYDVVRSGGRLFGRRGDRPREELHPLGEDRFFIEGAPRGERIFRRDARGRIDAMLSRRDNNDLVWRRTSGPATSAHQP